MENLNEITESMYAKKVIMGDISINDVPEEIELKNGKKKKLRDSVIKELKSNEFYDEAGVEENYDLQRN